MLWKFADFELNDATFELLRNGARVRLQRKPLQLLIFLVRHSDRTVCFDEIQRELWPNLTVTSSSLRRAVKVLRDALGSENRSWIDSVNGIGYRFVGELREPRSATDSIISARSLGSRPLLRGLPDSGAATHELERVLRVLGCNEEFLLVVQPVAPRFIGRGDSTEHFVLRLVHRDQIDLRLARAVHDEPHVHVESRTTDVSSVSA